MKTTISLFFALGFLLLSSDADAYYWLDNVGAMKATFTENTIDATTGEITESDNITSISYWTQLSTGANVQVTHDLSGGWHFGSGPGQGE